MDSYQEISRSLVILKSRISNDSRLKIFYFLGSTLFMLIGGGIALIPVILYSCSGNPDGINIFMIFGIIIIPYSILYGRDYIEYNLPKKILETYVGNIKELIESTQITISEVFTIEKILEQLEYVQAEIITINSKREFLGVAIMKESTRKSLDNSFKLITNWVLFILTDLRSDLQLRLEEQQKTLEQAKSEVEQNIHGTDELEQVSELQRARLDRQIEQFEELQRVLVKI